MTLGVTRSPLHDLPTLGDTGHLRAHRHGVVLDMDGDDRLTRSIGRHDGCRDPGDTHFDLVSHVTQYLGTQFARLDFLHAELGKAEDGVTHFRNFLLVPFNRGKCGVFGTLPCLRGRAGPDDIQ